MPEVISEIKEVSSGIVLVNMGLSEYQKKIPEILSYITKKKKIPGVYVSLNKPITVLYDSLKKKKVDTDMLVFIDAVSKMSNISIHNQENCFYLRSPKDLSDISIAISEALNSIKQKKKFLIFDSLNTLLLYSDEDLIARFFHFVLGKIRSTDINGFIVSIKKGMSNKLITEISQFCDDYIEL